MTKNTAAAASTIGSSDPVIGPIGSEWASSSTPAAATIASRYCAALNRILSGDTRAAKSAITELATYTSAAGPGPNRSRIANANAAEIVTRACPRRRGTGIGSSSPTSANTDSATSSAGSSTCHSVTHGSDRERPRPRAPRSRPRRGRTHSGAARVPWPPSARSRDLVPGRVRDRSGPAASPLVSATPPPRPPTNVPAGRAPLQRRSPPIPAPLTARAQALRPPPAESNLSAASQDGRHSHASSTSFLCQPYAPWRH